MKILDIAFKDLLRSSRSLFLVGMSFVAPLLLTFLIYFAFGSLKGGAGSMTAVKVGVVNADVLPTGAPLATSLGGNIRSMFFDTSVQSWITAGDYADEAAARAALNRQEIGVAVIIPATFTGEFLAGKSTTPILILQDPTLTIGPTVVRDMVSSLLDGVSGGGVAYRVINERLAANGKSLDPAGLPALIGKYSTWYANFQRLLFHSPRQAALVVTPPAAGDTASNSLQAVIGMVMAGQLIFFSFFTGAYSMTTILQESEEGTLARLFTTPTNRTIILVGKFLAVLLTVLIQGLVLLAAGRLIFGVHWGSPGALALAVTGQMFASVGLGVLLVAFIKTSKQAGPIFGGGLTALGMLGGLFTTNIAMPASFKAISNFTPQGWVLKAWTLSLEGHPASDLVMPFLVLVAMGILMFAFGAVMFRRRFT